MGGKKILAVLFKGNEAAKNPAFLACVENALGLRDWLQEQGHSIVLTADKDGENSDFDRELPDADIVITTPFHPAYLTRERIEKAKKLELCITAGIGSDHIDLHAASDKGITVAEVKGCNEVSVAEDVVMRCLILMRNFQPGFQQVDAGEWDVAAIAHKARDVQRRTIGSFGVGAIGTHVLNRLKPFDVDLVYSARHDQEAADKIGARRIKDFDEFLKMCDIITINVPLTDKTRGMFDKEVIDKMKKGAYLINTARGGIVDTEAVVDASKSGQLGGYGGDVWYPQPAPKDHPWRGMPNHAMTPHISGITLDAQERIADGTKLMLESWFAQKPFPEDFYIAREGDLAHAYK